MIKSIVFRQNALIALLKGANKLADPVSITLGPSGRHVVMEHMSNLAPVISKDGVSVAKNMQLEEPGEELGLRLLRDAAKSVSSNAGDGTTTVIVLGRAMIQQAIKAVLMGAHPTPVKKGMAQAGAAAIEALLHFSKECNTQEKLAYVGSLAANGDHGIGALVADCYTRLGVNCVVEVEMGNGLEDELDITEGTHYESGYISNQFVTDASTHEVELENPLFLITDQKITRFSDILPAFEIAKQERRPLVVMAEDVEEDALNGMVINTKKGIVPCVAIKPPCYGNTRLDAIDDMAIMTGGTSFMERQAESLENITLASLGGTDKIRVNAEHTTIIGPHGSEQAIGDRIRRIQHEVEQAETTSKSPSSVSDYEDKRIERISYLTGAIATIQVGGATDVEIKERLPLVENAKNSVKAAMEEGVLPGAGVALLRLQEVIDEMVGDTPDEEIGIRVVRDSLDAAAFQILTNACMNAEKVVATIRDQDDVFYGLNIQTGEYGDLFDLGVIDPTKVTRLALQYAIGCAASLITTEVLIHKSESWDPTAGFDPAVAAQDRQERFESQGYFD